MGIADDELVHDVKLVAAELGHRCETMAPMDIRWVGSVAGVLTAVLVGCGDSGGGAATATTPGESTTVMSTVPSVEVGTITLVKSGGIAGVHEQTTVNANGSVTVVVGRTDPTTRPDVPTVPAEDLSRLRALVTSAEFGSLAKTYVPAGGACCDRFEYQVTVQLGSTTKTVITADGLDVPRVLDDVVSLLDGLSTPP
jgi:hypothetical protein